MQEKINLNGTRYISAQLAASFSGLTRDHIGRLCREKRLVGTRIGRSWYIEESSLHSFFITHEHAKSLRSSTLRGERAAEYASIQKISPTPGVLKRKNTAGDSVGAEKNPTIHEQLSRMMDAPAGVSHAALSVAHLPLYTITPMMEVVHRLLAVTLALVITLGAYTLIDPQSAGALFAGITTGMHEDVYALADVYHAASDIDLQKSLSGVGQNGNGEFAAAVTSPSDAIAALEKTVSGLVASIIRSLPSLMAPPHELIGSSTRTNMTPTSLSH